MKLITLLSATVALLASANACEHDCQGNITAKFVQKFQPTLDAFFTALECNLTTATKASTKKAHRGLVELIPRAGCTVSSAVSSAVEPLRKDYAANKEFSTLHNGVFRTIRGTCVPKGTKALPGCPNYDCPVLCGSPGSLIHHYHNAFGWANGNMTAQLETLLTPGTGGDYASAITTKLGSSSKVKAALAGAVTYLKKEFCHAKSACETPFKADIVTEAKKWP